MERKGHAHTQSSHVPRGLAIHPCNLEIKHCEHEEDNEEWEAADPCHGNNDHSHRAKVEDGSMRE